MTGDKRMTHAGGVREANFTDYVKLLRISYWSKNLLVFVPAFLANALQDQVILIECLAGFLLLSLCASGTYIVNDLADAESDRLHATKRHRPLARKAISPRSATRLAFLLITLPLGAAALWKFPFALSLLAYCTASAAYTFLLKRYVLVDALWLSGMHTARLLMGVVLADVQLSGWLMAFALFFFFSLALAKRCGEIVLLHRGVADRMPGRSYTATDGRLVLAAGGVAAAASIAVLALYVVDREHSAKFYNDPKWLWLAALVVGLWLFHMWRKAQKGLLTSDPVTFAMRDPTSLLFFILLMLAMLLAK